MQEFVSLTISMFSYRAQMTRDCRIVIHCLTRVSAGQLKCLDKLNSLSMITLFRSLILPGAMSFQYYSYVSSNRHSASRYTLGYAKNVHFGEKALFGIPQPQQNYTNQGIVVPCTNGIENFSRPNG